jgi:Chemotaxis phosphatase CheX
MTNMPDARTLARLISTVTETMCGISFEPAVDIGRPEADCWRLAILPFQGARPIRVLLSSDRTGCLGLGAALLGYSADQLDPSMIDDSLCELLNMAAGQIKRALAVDDALGLPKIISGEAGQALFRTARHKGTALRSRGSLDLLIWVTEAAESA